jgi:cytochrome P450/ferredoxin-NADP reductase
MSELNRAPAYDVDFYSDAFIRDPLPHYAAMRALGPVVWLSKQRNYAVTRHHEARQVLHDWRTFSSAQGVAGDDAGCSFLKGNTLASDPPLHDEMRVAMAEPLLPGSLESIRSLVEGAAVRLIDDLVARRQFDGIADLARYLPLTIVTELVGLPEDGRENMLDWAAASFNILGVQNERGRKGIETVKEMRQWINTRATADRLKPDSWTARIYELVRDDKIDAGICPLLIRDYINPSLDTTISATGQLIYQLGKNPDQWRQLREHPKLIPGAVDEAVRLGSPIRSFSRTVVHDTALAGVHLAAGARLMVLFASSNRDETRFDRPDHFDVARRERDHIGFGHGIHMCVGMHLARLEMESLLKAMIARVETIDVGEPIIALNNTIHAFATLPVTFTPRNRELEIVNAGSTATAPVSRWIETEVVEVGPRTARAIAFELASISSPSLPEYAAGSHVDIEIEPGLVRQYSLCGSLTDGRRYRVAVQRDTASRGGSRRIHNHLAVGARFRVRAPRNLFHLNETAPSSLLFAGGIGITPILAMAYRLRALGRHFKLHYSAPSRKDAILLDEIQAFGSDHVELHFSDEGTRLDPSTVFPVDNGSHVYICGPARYISAVTVAAAALGWPDDRVHVERFVSDVIKTGDAFTVVAARSGVTVEVAEDQTILGALREAGVEVASSCESGVCATCLTDVLEGVPEHRDLVQTPVERASMHRIAVCCSRSSSRRLVLDV